jgi:long-chain acyl-CoA synthetase
MIKETLLGYVEDSIKKNWETKCFSDYQGGSYFFREVAEQIARLHIAFEKAGIKKGDKIALYGKNSSNWAISFLAVVTYGGIIVPILADFKTDDTHQIINHSDSLLLFSGEQLYEKLDGTKMGNIKCVFSLTDFSVLECRDEKLSKITSDINTTFNEKYKGNFIPDNVYCADVSNNDLAVISYTSGTTGFSKGVMLSHNSLAANIRYAHNNMPLEPGDPIVSFLPLAHTYGCAFEFLFPFTLGCFITFLTKTPSPQIIIKAFTEIRPTLIISVPLVIEKVYKKQVLPAISKNPLKTFLKIPLLNKLIYKKLNEKLSQAFGGNFHEVVIGGAAFNKEAEEFFRKIKFRYTVGYGMTECGPLISYASWDTLKIGSAGRPIDTLEVKINSNDPENEVGEIMLRGENVMDGYYKNEEVTREVIDENGWMHTGDLGLMDKEQNIFIKGRNKSLILGPSGKNIYPEEIESVINNKYCILESVVVSRNDKIIALICPDQDVIKQNKIGENELKQIMEQNKKKANRQLPGYMNISKFEIHPEEFIKTPKRSIKGYLYK